MNGSGYSNLPSYNRNIHFILINNNEYIVNINLQDNSYSLFTEAKSDKTLNS